MWFINQRYSEYAAIRISPSGLGTSEHYRFGQCIAKVSALTDRRIILIASGDLSHSLSDSGPYSFAPEGAEFDAAMTKAFSTGDFLSLLNVPERLRERAAECGYAPVLMLAGCFDRQNVDPKLLSYEGPFGVGYAVARIAPGDVDESRNFADQYDQFILKEADKLKNTEDAYRALARRSLESKILKGETMPIPEDVPDELLNRQAGAFVTLYKQDRLRGCIGTITPATDCIASEIINNAISAGLNDYRFDQILPSELPYLTYKVDILGKPERISGPEELDVRRYGVIVTSGNKRGLLLPNLDGIDTVEEQIAIARQKGGISDKDKVVLERFEVVRHE
jgi:AmmeMemoRadiSam system protein A